VGSHIVECTIDNKTTPQGNDYQITTLIGGVQYNGPKTIDTAVGQFTGHCLQVGNPHFIIFQEIALQWLRDNGMHLEAHAAFPQRTNVAFVWEVGAAQHDSTEKTYNVMIY